jgi:hypothetical protein
LRESVDALKCTQGDRRGAGTDANVFITVCGENSDSGKRKLEGKGNCFERGKTDEFGIECVDLGELKKIRIEHDNSGFGASWFLDKVVITNLQTKKDYYFLCGRWLSKSEDDGEIVREIAASDKDGVSCLPLSRYKISVLTVSNVCSIKFLCCVHRETEEELEQMRMYSSLYLERMEIVERENSKEQALIASRETAEMNLE